MDWKKKDDIYTIEEQVAGVTTRCSIRDRDTNFYAFIIFIDDNLEEEFLIGWAYRDTFKEAEEYLSQRISEISIGFKKFSKSFEMEVILKLI